MQLFFLSVDYLGWWPGFLGLECKQLRGVTDETGTPVDARMVFRDSFHANLSLKQVGYLQQVDSECKTEY